MTNTFVSAVDARCRTDTLRCYRRREPWSSSRPRKGGRGKLELGDAIQRILRRHWNVIVLALVVGLAIPVVAHARDKKQYVATSRMVIDAADPKNSQASAALADAAQ